MTKCFVLWYIFVSFGLLLLFALSAGFGQQMGYTEIAMPITLNPLFMEDIISFRFSSLIYDGLWKKDIYSIPVPHLLESLDPIEKISDIGFSLKPDGSLDGRKYTFRLKNGVRWHPLPSAYASGSSSLVELTAADVEFTYKMIKNSQTPTIYNDILGRIRNIKVVDKYLIEVTLRNRAPKDVVLSELHFKILPAHCFTENQKHIQPDDDFGRKVIVGTGPFRFHRYNPDSIELRRYHDYFLGWRKLPDKVLPIDGILMQKPPDENVALGMLMTGREIQLIPDTRPADWIKLRRPEIDLRRYHSRGFMYIGYNCQRAHFNIKEVREALTYAVNRLEMLKVIYGEDVDEKQIISGPYPPGEGDATIKPRQNDPNKARELLKSAGFNVDEPQILDRNGEAFSFTLKTYVKREDEHRICERYQSQLAEIGIKVNIQYVEKNKWLKEVIKERNFDAVFHQWVFNEDTNIVADLFAQGSGSNFVGYFNPEVTALILANEVEFDPDIRKQNKYKLHGILHDACPYTFLFSVPKRAAVRQDKLGGVDIHPYDFFTYIARWYLTSPTYPCPP